MENKALSFQLRKRRTKYLPRQKLNNVETTTATVTITKGPALAIAAAAVITAVAIAVALVATNCRNYVVYYYLSFPYRVVQSEDMVMFHYSLLKYLRTCSILIHG